MNKAAKLVLDSLLLTLLLGLISLPVSTLGLSSYRNHTKANDVLSAEKERVLPILSSEENISATQSTRSAPTEKEELNRLSPKP